MKLQKKSGSWGPNLAEEKITKERREGGGAASVRLRKDERPSFKKRVGGRDRTEKAAGGRRGARLSKTE